MRLLVYRKHQYEVYNTEGSLVIVNTKGSYENHAHLTKIIDSKGNIKLDVAKTLIDIVIKKKIPKSNYLVTSAMRLTTDEEYKNNLMKVLDRRKGKKYINSSKGVRRW